MATAPKIFKSEVPRPEIKSYFASIPWALELFNDPSLRPFTSRQQLVGRDYTGDTFYSRTLATQDTIAIWQSFWRPSPSKDGSKEFLCLLQLGSGVNGHIDICHGGFISGLLDEVMGIAAEHEKAKDNTTLTVTLKIDYKRPVPTPGAILCRSSVTRREGRKMWTKSSIEDGHGIVFATGEGLFLEVDVGKVKSRGKL